ncbi:MAG TPA: KEOPS complex subunit Cgi121 [Candidatus Nitrosopolaris sp.]|nr:KEOPS complex subunit Cgi121 [Candidatus Nitrosopolaris sp.]
MKDIGEFIDDLRKTLNGGVSVQAVCADAVYGIEHIRKVLRITIESEKRKITLAVRPEMDLLLRIACTDQISIALRNIGLRNQGPGCFILLSKEKKELIKVTRHICKTKLKIDDSVLRPSTAKKELISRRLGVQLNKFLSNDDAFTSYLSEKAALLTK